MLIARAKYDQLASEKDALTAQVLQLQSAIQTLTKDLEQMQSQIPVTDQQLAAELESANTQLSQARQENQGLKDQVDNLSQLNNDLTEANTLLAQGPAESSAVAPTKTDNTITTYSLNDFCRENNHDTMACIEKLREEGF